MGVLMIGFVLGFIAGVASVILFQAFLTYRFVRAVVRA